MFAAEEEKAKARISELETERSKVLLGREDVAAKLPRNLVRRYDQIRERRGSGVAFAEEGHCLACRIALAPQMFIELQRGEELLQCPSCVRILIYRPLVDD